MIDLPRSPTDGPPQLPFVNRAIIAVSISALVALSSLLVIFGIQVVLMVFAGILFAAFLCRLTRLLEQGTGLAYASSFGCVLLLLTLLTVGGLWLLGSQIASQLDELITQVSESKQHVSEWLSKYRWGRTFLAEIPNLGELLQSRSWSPFSGINRLFSSAVGILTTGFVVIFLAIYFAAAPHAYIDGLIRLVPPARRERVHNVLVGLGDTLWKWMLGRLASMAIIAVGGAIGLWFLGIPLPITLGVLAGLLTFIPNIGGILGVIAPALLALRQSPETLLWVLAYFAVLQLIESNLLTPLIQQHQVSVPPGLLLSTQVLMGVLTGLLGIAMATPLVAVLIVLVKEFYVKDFLESKANNESSQSSIEPILLPGSPT